MLRLSFEGLSKELPNGLRFGAFKVLVEVLNQQRT